MKKFLSILLAAAMLCAEETDQILPPICGNILTLRKSFSRTTIFQSRSSPSRAKDW